MSSFSNYKYVDSLSKKNKLLRALWGVVWTILCRFTPKVGFNGWRLVILKMFGAKIGKGSIVLPTCRVWAPWNLEMGQYSVLGDNVDCYTMDKITIGSKVAISQRAFLCTGTHDITSFRRPLVTKPIVIEDHVWVCAEAMVHPGITLSEGSVVAAKAVVTKDVNRFEVVAGNPAKFVKLRTLN